MYRYRHVTAQSEKINPKRRPETCCQTLQSPRQKDGQVQVELPADRNTSLVLDLASIATLVCSGLWAGQGPRSVGAGALILLAPPLAHYSTIPVPQGGGPEEQLEASDLEAQEVWGQALALLTGAIY